MQDSYEEIAQNKELEAMPRKRIGAGALIVDDQMRVLLVEPTYISNWEVPGGLVELAEQPREAARREVLEELGIEIELGRLLVVDWVPPRRLPDDGIMFVYETKGIDTSRIQLSPDELVSWAWCDREMMIARLPDFMFRRLEFALQALTTGASIELENGFSTNGK